jgi:DNA-binding transcriptional MerR regulator
MDFESHASPPDASGLSQSETLLIPDGANFSITDLADAFGITTRALRFYEDHALLRPERRGQTRIYTRADFVRLAWVLRGKRVGFSLAEIKELLDLYDIGDGRATQRAKTLEKCRERLATLEAQRQDLNAMIDELQQFCTTVETMVPPAKSGKAKS